MALAHGGVTIANHCAIGLGRVKVANLGGFGILLTTCLSFTTPSVPQPPLPIPCSLAGSKDALTAGGMVTKSLAHAKVCKCLAHVCKSSLQFLGFSNQPCPRQSEDPCSQTFTHTLFSEFICIYTLSGRYCGLPQAYLSDIRVSRDMGLWVSHYEEIVCNTPPLACELEVRYPVYKRG